MHLSVIIPAYNEETRLSETLLEIDKYLKRQTYDYEILVVSDGSSDKTVEVAESLTLKIKNLTVTGYKKNQGKGCAVRFGMLEAKGRYRLFTDADNSTNIDQIEKMWPWFKEGFDIIIGSREVKKGAVLDPPQSFFRKTILGEGFRLLSQIICGTGGISDTQCGFKCFTEKAAKSIFPKCKIKGFTFDQEVLARGRSLGYKIKEIPVYWKNNPHSKVKFKNILEMAIDLIKIRFRTR